jgi:hypothetical protein
VKYRQLQGAIRFPRFVIVNSLNVRLFLKGALLQETGHDNVTLLFPSYFSPLRNMPYMGCSNFLAIAMSTCRRASFRAKKLSKKAFAWGSQRDATRAGM